MGFAGYVAVYLQVYCRGKLSLFHTTCTVTTYLYNKAARRQQHNLQNPLMPFLGELLLNSGVQPPSPTQKSWRDFKHKSSAPLQMSPGMYQIHLLLVICRSWQYTQPLANTKQGWTTTLPAWHNISCYSRPLADLQDFSPAIFQPDFKPLYPGNMHNLF
jgi:hypothetical protein